MESLHSKLRVLMMRQRTSISRKYRESETYMSFHYYISAFCLSLSPNRVRIRKKSYELNKKVHKELYKTDKSQNQLIWLQRMYIKSLC